MSKSLPYSSYALLVVAVAMLLMLVPASGAEKDDLEGTECFVSSYYRRVVTQEGFNKIQITVTLPTIYRDAQRFMMDGSHIYLGSSYQAQGYRVEVDAGLAYDVTRNRWGEIDRVNLAWRPFIRTATAYEYAPATAEFYWYPGEEVTLTYEIVRPGYVALTVSGAGKHYEFEPLPATGFNLEGRQFMKWVVSLDQSGREGKGPVPTTYRVEGAHVRDVTLWRPDGTAVPLTEEYVNKPRTCIFPEPSPFTIEFNTKYADEVISIAGYKE